MWSQPHFSPHSYEDHVILREKGYEGRPRFKCPLRHWLDAMTLKQDTPLGLMSMCVDQESQHGPATGWTFRGGVSVLFFTELSDCQFF